MVRFFLFMILSFSIYSTNAQTFKWVKGIGGTGDDIAKAVAVDSFGNIYTTGYFSGVVDFDPNQGVYNLISKGLEDVFISKLDSNGNFVWAINLGGDSTDQGNSLVLDSVGNIYVIGTFRGTADFDPTTGTSSLISKGQSDIFVCKININAELVWVMQFGDTLIDLGKSIAVDIMGNTYLTGSTQITKRVDPNLVGYAPVPFGDYKIWVLKLSSAGTLIWDHKIGSENNFNIGNALCLDLEGNVCITGSFSGIVDFDPDILNESIVSVTGYKRLSSAFNKIQNYYDFRSIFILKLDTVGKFKWVKASNTIDGSMHGNAICVDKIGNISIAGDYSMAYFQRSAGSPRDYFGTILGFKMHFCQDDIHPFILSLDKNGNELFGGGILDNCRDVIGSGSSITKDLNNNIYSSGTYVYSYTFLSKFDINGNNQWGNAFKSSSFGSGSPGWAIYQISNSITLDKKNNIIMSGQYDRAQGYDQNKTILDSIAAFGKVDIFIAKFNNSSNSTGILAEKNQEGDLNVYPNPFSDEFTLTIPNEDIGKKYDIIDLNGRQLLNGILDSQVFKINLGNVSAGFYLLQIAETKKKLKLLKF